MENEMLDGDKGSGRVAPRKSREELNEIEKQRTKRINSHILSLRNLLEMSNIVTKKDKFSVLKNTHDYIIKLRQALHTAEEKIEKIHRSRSSGSSVPVEQDHITASVSPAEIAFMNSTVAMILTGVDGHIVSCNDAFTSLSGYTQQEVLSTSIFNMTLPEEMTQMFQMVSTMLSFPQERTKHFTKTCKFHDRDEFCFVSMWIVREDDGEPLYFQMVMVPMVDCAGIVGSTMETEAVSSSPVGADFSSVGSDGEGIINMENGHPDLDDLRSEMHAGPVSMVTGMPIEPLQPVRRLSSGGNDFQQMLRTLQEQHGLQQQVGQRLV